MPNIFDNIGADFLENEFGNGLKDALRLARRGDFCVGYFNLRGWRCIDTVVGGWSKADGPDEPEPCRASCAARNRFVLNYANDRHIPHIAPGSALAEDIAAADRIRKQNSP